MIKKSIAVVFAALTLMSHARAELIVLAAPLSTDPYYYEIRDEIFEFHVGFASRIQGDDQVLILTDAVSFDQYAEVLGQDRVVVAPMGDIWIRDFASANPVNPVMFRYTSEGQGGGRAGQRAADAIQDQLAGMARRAGLTFRKTGLLNDGGNLVEDYAGNAVLSRKFLRDNNLSETRARSVLRELLDIENVAFIEADEQGGLEHADGVVSFVDENTLIINSYPDDPDYVRDLKADLRQGLPGVAIYEIVAPYDGREIYDEKFGSACGLYTNALVTPERVYLPQFGIPQDAVALRQVRSATDREVVPIPSSQVCFMGGGVRCMSWQLRGQNAARLKAYFGR